MKHVVIVPAHNEQALIGRMLDSLVAQTERPDRIVVVDDGSTAATADIVRDLARAHPWIDLIQGPGKGERGYRVVEAFNAGYAAVQLYRLFHLNRMPAPWPQMPRASGAK